MGKTSSFYEPLTTYLLSQRVLERREPLYLLFFLVFFLSYVADHFLRESLGLGQYTLAAFVSVVSLVIILAILGCDITTRRWQRFYLHPGEVIFARKGLESIVVKSTEEIRSGALEGCSDITIIHTWPWGCRRFECLVGKHKTAFLLSIKVVSLEAYGLERWLRLSESDVLSDFRHGAQDLAAMLGVGRALESPHEFAQLLTELLNNRLFSNMGVQILVSPTAEQEGLRSSAEESLLN